MDLSKNRSFEHRKLLYRKFLFPYFEINAQHVQHVAIFRFFHRIDSTLLPSTITSLWLGSLLFFICVKCDSLSSAVICRRTAMSLICGHNQFENAAGVDKHTDCHSSLRYCSPSCGSSDSLPKWIIKLLGQ